MKQGIVNRFLEMGIMDIWNRGFHRKLIPLKVWDLWLIFRT